MFDSITHIFFKYNIMNENMNNSNFIKQFDENLNIFIFQNENIII